MTPETDAAERVERLAERLTEIREREKPEFYEPGDVQMALFEVEQIEAVIAERTADKSDRAKQQKEHDAFVVGSVRRFNEIRDKLALAETRLAAAMDVVKAARDWDMLYDSFPNALAAQVRALIETEAEERP